MTLPAKFPMRFDHVDVCMCVWMCGWAVAYATPKTDNIIGTSQSLSYIDWKPSHKYFVCGKCKFVWLTKLTRLFSVLTIKFIAKCDITSIDNNRQGQRWHLAHLRVIVAYKIQWRSAMSKRHEVFFSCAFFLSPSPSLPLALYFSRSLRKVK